MKHIILFLALFLFAGNLSSDPPDKKGILLNITGPIGPSTSDYIGRNLDALQKQEVELVILRIDTPGGLDAAMREIIKNILDSAIPVVSYVAPNGARAASAGTFILYASHVAAMAPATNVGAATPVSISGPAPVPGDEKDKETPSQPDAKTSKAVNDAVAYIRSLAELRDRNADWAEKAVREAASLSARKALELDVIDSIATSLDDLLMQLDGREVDINNTTILLNTKDLAITEIEPDWRSKFLSVITDPNIAYILMLIGIYGIIFELANPGTIISGVIGVISLLLALFAFQVLDVNYAGLALMLLGVAMMIGEAFVPSFGALGIGGIVAFVTGSIILMDTDVPGFGISPTLIGAIAFFSAVTFTLVIGLAIKARKKSIVSGKEEIIGDTGVAITEINDSGRIRFEGEIWNATSPIKIHKGQKVRVTNIKGLLLTVEPIEEIENGR